MDQSKGSIIVFDTETTGLVEPAPAQLDKQPQIIEFAAIKYNNDLEEIDRLEFFVDPGIQLPDVIKKITKIQDSDVKGQGEFALHLNKLQEFFTGAVEMVAHNLMFDHDILKFELERIDMVTQFPWPKIRTCTVEKTMHLKGFRLNLTKLHEYCFGEGFDGAHRAMADVEALARCFIYLRKADKI